jgi:cobalt/nickel transport system permease protein
LPLAPPAMTLRFSLPPCADSPLGRLDPRWRLAALAPAALAAAALRTPLAALLALAGALLLAGFTRLRPCWFLGRLAPVALFLVLFAAPLPFLLDTEGLAWHWGPIAVSERGLAVGLVLFAKGLAVATLALVLLAAGPLDATLKAARALRVPGLLVQLALLTWRYVFVLAEELRRLRIALRVRGWRNRPTRHSYRTLGHVAGTLLVRSHERAERVGQAMRCRGFDGRFRALAEFRTRAADVLAFALIVGSAAALCSWDWLLAEKG